MKITNIEITKKVTDHKSALARTQAISPKSTDILKEELIQRIVNLNDGLREFWQDADIDKWASLEGVQLLSKSQLDWQVSLSNCLRIWMEEPSSEIRDGYLILGWANLGSLVEGTMKLFLSVYLEEYESDQEYAIFFRGKLKNPDGLQFEHLRQYFKKRIWEDTWDNWIQYVQQKRNAIHAFKYRNIGTHSDLQNSIRKYLEFLRYINIRLPYPDENFVPKEIESGVQEHISVVLTESKSK